MDTKIEPKEAQQTPEETTPDVVVIEETPKEEPKVEESNEVTISKSELEDLTKKADVSSQNFERAKKAEVKLKEFDSLEDNTILSEEDEDTADLKDRLSSMEVKLAESDVQKANPVLMDCWDEFKTYQADPENEGMPLKTAAKAFIAEKGLNTPARKGLEKVTGGASAPQPSGMSNEDIMKLRTTNWKKYRSMLKKGQIKT